MGSRSIILKKHVEFAYIAGFLDGDGSIMLQIKKRSDARIGWRFMCTICFYQDSRHEKPLYWIRKKLNIGYISKRNDRITELRINGYNQCEKIMKSLYPYIRFKKPQAEAFLRAAHLLKRKQAGALTSTEKQRLIKYMMKIQSCNYQSSGKRSAAQYKKMIGLTP